MCSTARYVNYCAVGEPIAKLLKVKHLSIDVYLYKGGSRLRNGMKIPMRCMGMK